MAKSADRRKAMSHNPVSWLKNCLIRLLRSEDGQDLIEYALTVGFVAVAAAAIFPTTLMPNVSTIFSKIESSMVEANGS